MNRWQLSVWTRFAAPLEEVWRLKTDVQALSDEFAPLRIRVDDPAGLQQAVRSGGSGTFAGRLSGPFGLVTLGWPIEIRSTDPMREYRDTSHNVLFHDFEHRHRFEETIDGKVRYVDEVRFTPAIGPERLAVELTRRLFVRRHRKAARHLPTDKNVVGVSMLRRYNPDLEPDHPDVAKGD